MLIKFLLLLNYIFNKNKLTVALQNEMSNNNNIQKEKWKENERENIGKSKRS